MSTKAIYLLFVCDAWKENMKLAAVATTPTRLKSAIIRAIHAGKMRYGIGTVTEQIRNLRADYKDRNSPKWLINNKLDHGYLDIAYDGEEY